MKPRPPSPYRRSPERLQALPRRRSSSSRRLRSCTLNDVRNTSLPYGPTDRDTLSAPGVVFAHSSASHHQRSTDRVDVTRRDPSGGSTTSLATDSAYGTLDDTDFAKDDDEDDEDELSPNNDDTSLWAIEERGAAWRDRVEASLTARSRRRVQSAVAADGWQLAAEYRSQVGDGLYWRRNSRACSQDSSPEVVQEPAFGSSDVAYDADSSFDSLPSLWTLSTAAQSTVPLSPCSTRSSPGPDEHGESDSGATQLTIARKRRTVPNFRKETAEELTAGFLARRHTLPRRHKPKEAGRNPSTVTSRRASRSSITPSEADAALLDCRRLPPGPDSTSLVPSLTGFVLVATGAVSIISLLCPARFVVPISPIHLRHATSPVQLAIQLSNAALAIFLVQPTMPSVLLASTNLYLARELDLSTPRLSCRTKTTIAAISWAAIVGLRILASWVFGRALGWAYPRFLSTRAIHEVGAGLGPLLLALYLLEAAITSRSKPFSTTVPALIALNFIFPVAKGGSGMWLGGCGAVVGTVAALLVGILRATHASPRLRSAQNVPVISNRAGQPLNRTSSLFALLLLPSLAFYASLPTAPPHQTDLAFSQLHPSNRDLLTVLLMTAPRPGNPDFLVQTIESWLGAFPDPDLASRFSTSRATNETATLAAAGSTRPTSSRLRLVVYTHFSAHAMFDRAQAHFLPNPKAAHYVSWYRDPRTLLPGAEDRLDQRLHVARGLEYAAGLGGAYVLLTEDDFPLCEDEPRPIGGLVTPPGGRSWTDTWSKLQAALVATNRRMPDGEGDDEAAMGHCGLFLATGGSGLVIRTPLAARLPALLLGADDPHGYLREAAAAHGEITLRREGEGADTPDLVIQDCLRGRLPECAICAPAGAGLAVPLGSARYPRWAEGDRTGKSGLAGTERLLQRHLGYAASTLPGRQYGQEEWACGWRQPFNGEPDVLTV